jgi:hypothetical protein
MKNAPWVSADYWLCQARSQARAGLFQPAEAQPAAFFTVRLDPRVVFEFPLELFHRLT